MKIQADIVLLLDISSSMAPALAAVRTAWVSFVKQLLDPTTPDAPRVDLRLKVVGYAMSEDDTQPVIRDNPFVHNDVEAFDAQLANLKIMPTNHSPRPLLDVLWQVGCMGEVVPESLTGTADKWRVCWNRTVAVYTDSPCLERTISPKTGGASLGDICQLLMRARISLHILAPSHQHYEMMHTLPHARLTNISVGPTDQAMSEWILRIAVDAAKAHGAPCNPRPPPAKPRCAVRDTDHGCEIWTEGDASHDALIRLDAQLPEIIIDGPVRDPTGRFEIACVRHSEGDNLRAEQIRPFLRDQSDFDLVEHGEIGHEEQAL